MTTSVQKHTATTGSIGGTPVVTDTKSTNGHGQPWDIVYVTLSADYLAVNPPGFPDRPPIGAIVKWTPGVIPNGTRRQFHACEAAAIVAAGGGSYS